MTLQETIQAIICPECQAQNPVERNDCWLCHQPLVSAPPAKGRPPAACERNAAWQFSMGSLMVTVALLSVLFGLYRIAMGWGILVTIFVVPPLVATCITVAVRKSRGETPTMGEKFAIFASSTAVLVGVLVAVVASLIAALAGVCMVMAGGGEPEVAVIALLVTFGAIAVATAVVFGIQAALKRSRATRR